MKLIIAGSRDLHPTDEQIERAIHRLESLEPTTEIVCGGARGVDQAGADYGQAHKLKVRYFPAQWDRYGKSAGVLRNQEMAEYADALLAFWDGKSNGTRHMIERMKQLKKPVHVEVVA